MLVFWRIVMVVRCCVGYGDLASRYSVQQAMVGFFKLVRGI